MATSSSNGICLWCSQPISTVQQIPNCSIHKICNNCQIKKRSSQSACPCCWYVNGWSLLSSMNVCAVCRNLLKPIDAGSVCVQNHKRCTQCPPVNCHLCNFLQLRSYANISFENLPANAQQIILFLDAVEKKFEENQQTKPVYNREDSTSMDVDCTSAPIQNSTPAKPNAQTHDCRICLDDLDATSVTLPVCQHLFHRECIKKWFQSSGKQTCPTCGHIYGIIKGPQPAHGQMTTKFIPTPLPGCSLESHAPNEGPTIEINYTIPSGIQGPQNPQPGQPYSGTVRTAYLPNNAEGKYVLSLLKKAFDDQHIFCVGKSTTTGKDNVVTWNDIHHKTQINGGPEQFGYPDPTYLTRVRGELADKGYK